jgi:hypothetical protein
MVLNDAPVISHMHTPLTVPNDERRMTLNMRHQRGYALRQGVAKIFMLV